MTTQDNDTLSKIKSLYTQKGWSVYRLAKESDIPYSSLNNMILRNTHPSIPTLQKICTGLGISLRDFFDDETDLEIYKNILRLSDEEFTLIENYRMLDAKQSQLLQAYLAGLQQK